MMALLALTVGVGPVWRAWAQGQGVRRRYFPETGHTVQGDFLKTYEAVPQAETLLGYPITEMVETNGIYRQYFQRAVMQQGPNDEQPKFLELGRIFWRELQDKVDRRPADLRGISLNSCEVIEEHFVCRDFLTFYRAYADVIGPPVSDAQWENGVLVQYFRGVRLVYRDGLVTPSDLGVWFFEFFEPNKTLRLPVVGDFAPMREIARIHADAEVAKITTARGEAQTLYVLVTDQIGQPLHHAEITVTLTDIRGNRLAASTDRQKFYTNAQGGAEITFDAPQIIGRVIVYVTVAYQDKRVVTQTTFRVWY